MTVRLIDTQMKKSKPTKCTLQARFSRQLVKIYHQLSEPLVHQSGHFTLVFTQQLTK